jgi:hypothetical protein
MDRHLQAVPRSNTESVEEPNLGIAQSKQPHSSLSGLLSATRPSRAQSLCMRAARGRDKVGGGGLVTGAFMSKQMCMNHVRNGWQARVRLRSVSPGSSQLYGGWEVTRGLRA